MKKNSFLKFFDTMNKATPIKPWKYILILTLMGVTHSILYDCFFRK